MIRKVLEIGAVILALIALARFLTGCGGEVAESAQTEASCTPIEPREVYDVPGCYQVPDEPLLSFSFFQAGPDCRLTNNGQELHSFTLWDIVEPGELTIDGCESFRLQLTEAEPWQ